MKKLGLVVLSVLMLAGCDSKASTVEVTNKAFDKSDIIATTEEQTEESTVEETEETTEEETTVAETNSEDIMTDEELVDRIINVNAELINGFPNATPYNRNTIVKLVEHDKKLTLAAYYMMLIDEHPEKRITTLNDLHARMFSGGAEEVDAIADSVSLQYYTIIKEYPNILDDAEASAIKRHNNLLGRIEAGKESRAAEEAAKSESIANSLNETGDSIVWSELITDHDTLYKELGFGHPGPGNGVPIELQLGKRADGTGYKRYLFYQEEYGTYVYCEWSHTSNDEIIDSYKETVDAKTLADCSAYYQN